MPKVFRKTPPVDLIERILVTLGIKGIQDTTWFSKSCIHLTEFEELLPEIEPYYIPCKAKEYIHIDMSSSKVITIIRHLLASQGTKLDYQEKTTNGVKNIWYRISYDKKLVGEAIIEFN
jgi:hypothetical protein